jgi:hypothetical protein
MQLDYHINSRRMIPERQNTKGLSEHQALRRCIGGCMRGFSSHVVQRPYHNLLETFYRYTWVEYAAH